MPAGAVLTGVDVLSEAGDTLSGEPLTLFAGGLAGGALGCVGLRYGLLTTDGAALATGAPESCDTLPGAAGLVGAALVGAVDVTTGRSGVVLGGGATAVG